MQVHQGVVWIKIITSLLSHLSYGWYMYHRDITKNCQCSSQVLFYQKSSHNEKVNKNRETNIRCLCNILLLHSHKTMAWNYPCAAYIEWRSSRTRYALWFWKIRCLFIYLYLSMECHVKISIISVERIGLLNDKNVLIDNDYNQY